jgi:alkylation response protein AidB-like acyl-CoA dehydrogenase
MRRIADLDDLSTLPDFEHADPDMVKSLLEEAARFAEEVIAPVNRDGDLIGSVHNDDGTVSTPPGFVDAYKKYVEAGWGALSLDPDYDGGGFPVVVGLAIEEMFTAASMAFSLCPLLTQGAINMLTHHGTEEQKEIYLRRMVNGVWSATMNLTEPEAGSDVGALAAKAVRNDDGTYRITGTKIFITYGEHDMAENIIHLVLARTPDAPPGTMGISCFIVPKFLVSDDGALGERNDVACLSIEHKLGIHGSPTCVMAFGDNEGAVGHLIGEENAGMRYMFTMMNHARLSVGLEGIAIAERSYQQALAHAHERRQGRAPGREADASSPIIDHPDVQRMLLDMKSTIAAMRGLAYLNAEAIDRSLHAVDEADRNAAAERAALLTPLTKAWCTDLGCDLTSIGLQIHGGMGYVEETGSAQHFRDARIAPIYEGTNGIQAIDLVGRKVPQRGGGVVRDHLLEMTAICRTIAGDAELAAVHDRLDAALDATTEATEWLLVANRDDPIGVLAGANAYLKMLATTTAGSALVKGVLSAREHDGDDVVADRTVMARFFASHRMATVPGWLPAVTESGPDLGAATERILTL